MTDIPLNITSLEVPKSISWLLNRVKVHCEPSAANQQDLLCFLARINGELIQFKVAQTLGEGGSIRLYRFARSWYKFFCDHAESWSNQNVKVTVKLAEGLKEAGDPEDREGVPTDPIYDTLSLPHDCPWEAVECISDWFHDNYAIAVLEDFVISYEWSKL